ncbi:insulinase family protein [Alkalimonas delamerensis]|uniref:Protease 3 n=1 Tax=Alkalimonas delamerensis TaxID=265981 RepID=A0ABT9GMI6_9GAMM|nr:insulinase family protein [Alkalimonas delamerensis]MDP4528180.1 insulinase family protein [Alkalimonas delamerensis]
MKKIEIKQSPNDPKQYHYLTLENGLAVLLIQQADAEKSAAALCVRAGHFDDPNDRQGLAHFTEHMLFLGSQHYPVAGSFGNFASHHGGSSNAWTGTEYSTYFFDCDNNHFAEGLHRFADMFSHPLFADGYIEKERQAIEAEFTLKLKDDGRRIYQVHKETVNPAHPFAKFSVGNLQTLADTPEQSLREALLTFYQRFYVANQMTLVLVSPAAVEQQQQWVEQYFTELTAGDPKRDWLQQPLYLPEQLGLDLLIEPHKEMHKLVVTFALPCIQHWYPYKLISFIAHLLGDEGPGSLHTALKSNGWINQLSAGGGVDGSNFKDFSISCELTLLGMSVIDDITAVIFNYLAMLQTASFPGTLYQERQQLLHWSFLYQEPSTPEQTATELAVNMHHYPTEDVVFGDYRMETPPESLYRQVLSYFRPDNMRRMLIAPGLETSQQARWYDTPYQVQPLPVGLQQALSQARPTSDLQLPTPNPYLVSELRLLPPNATQPRPLRIHQSDALTLWFKADADFHTPKGHIYLQLSLPHSTASCWHLAATRLWVELLNDEIQQVFYPATTAGLGYSAHVQKQGISLHSYGLSHNQIQLLMDVLNHIRHFQIQPERFTELKQQLMRHWRDSHKNKPVASLFSQLSAVMHPHNPGVDQLLHQLSTMTTESFGHFNQQLLQQLHVEAFMTGNWQQQDATELQQQLLGWLANVETCPVTRDPERSIQGQGPVWLTVAVEHPDHALVIYLPAQDKSPKQMALFMLANHLLAPRYFHQLRTEQQLGYLVGTGYVPVNTLPGLAFYIQSPHSNCQQLYQATLAFYRDFLASLEALSPLEFAELKQGLLQQLNENDTSLSSRAKRLWLAIGQQDETFNLTERIRTALETLNLESFIHFFYQLLSPDYDALFLATDSQPSHSHLRFMSAAEFISELETN